MLSVGKNLRLTACHVVERLRRPMTPVLGFSTSSALKWRAQPVKRTEILQFDLGLLEIDDLPHTCPLREPVVVS
jgi:hypothetical protein